MTAAFLLALLVAAALRLWLGARQERAVRTHRDEVPEAFRDAVSLEDHRKAADYAVARLRLGRVGLAWRVVVLLGFTLGGGLAALDGLATRVLGDGLAGGTAFVLAAFGAAALLDLPLAVYRTFVLEQRFGFNRTTPALFAADLVRSAVLGVAIGAPLVAAALWLVRDGGRLWWVALWAGWLAVSVLFAWAWPVLVAPLFWRFEPLGDDALRARLEALLRRTGFASRGVFVMDGSRRSAHANAYFAGLGRQKRIVLFDTLLEAMGPDEVEAVLAHEIGHSKLRHVRRRIAGSAAFGLAALAAFAWLLERSWFFTGLGVPEPSAHAGLVLFLWIAPVFTFPLSPLLSAWSRRHEYEADAFAARHADADAMVRALVTLYAKNATTLTPDPLHSRFYDSHPPAPLRVAHLRSLARAT